MNKRIGFTCSLCVWMIQKRFFPCIVIFSLFFALGMAAGISSAQAGVRYLSLSQFGIEKMPSTFLSRKGASFTGKVTDAEKLRLTNQDLASVQKGDRVSVTNLGNGRVEVRHIHTGSQTVIDLRITEEDYNTYLKPGFYRGTGNNPATD